MVDTNNPNWITVAKGVETRNQILELIQRITDEGETVHRAVIARELNVTRNTAGHHVDVLIQEGKVREVNGRFLEVV